MTKAELITLMASTDDAMRVDFLSGFLLDRMSELDATTQRHIQEIAMFLMAEYRVFGGEQCVSYATWRFRVAREISRTCPREKCSGSAAEAPCPAPGRHQVGVFVSWRRLDVVEKRPNVLLEPHLPREW